MTISLTMVTRREPKQARAVAAIEAILDAAAELLVGLGFEATTTTAVAAAAGVSVGTVYQYFPNKETLITALAQREGGKMLELFQESVMRLAGAPLEVAVPIACDALLRAHQLNADLNRIFVQHTPQVGQQHWTEIEEFARSLVRAFLAAHAEEIVPRDLDAASFVVVSMVEGITYSALMHPEGAPELDALREETIAAVTSYLLGRRAARATASDDGASSVHIQSNRRASG